MPLPVCSVSRLASSRRPTVVVAVRPRPPFVVRLRCMSVRGVSSSSSAPLSSLFVEWMSRGETEQFLQQTLQTIQALDQTVLQHQIVRDTTNAQAQAQAQQSFAEAAAAVHMDDVTTHMPPGGVGPDGSLILAPTFINITPPAAGGASSSASSSSSSTPLASSPRSPIGPRSPSNSSGRVLLSLSPNPHPLDPSHLQVDEVSLRASPTSTARRIAPIDAVLAHSPSSSPSPPGSPLASPNSIARKRLNKPLNLPSSPRLTSPSPPRSPARHISSPLPVSRSPQSIQRFYFPDGIPATPDERKRELDLIDQLWHKSHPNGTDGLTVEELFPLTTLVCGFSSYCNSALFGKLFTLQTELKGHANSAAAATPAAVDPALADAPRIQLDTFLHFHATEIERFDLPTRFFRLLRTVEPPVQTTTDGAAPAAAAPSPAPTHSSAVPGQLRRYLTRDDFKPIVQEIVNRHPGLEFLESTPEFQLKYAQTVIARIFYQVNLAGNEKLTMRELRESNFLLMLALLDQEDDINKLNDYFSYEHFYVIYCFADDHQLLTDQGFKGVDQLIEIQAAGALPRMASYNPKTECIEYHPVHGRVVLPPTEERTIVDLVHRPDDGDKIVSANQVSLSVTGDHDMYARFGQSSATSSDPSLIEWSNPCVEKEFKIVKAAALASDDDTIAVKLLAHAAGGVQVATPTPLPFEDALGLRGEDEVRAFVELYGLWITAGSLLQPEHERGALRFCTRRESDYAYLDALLRRLSIAPADLSTTSDSVGSRTTDLLSAVWVDLFAAKYTAIGDDKPLWEWVLTGLDKHMCRSLLAGMCAGQAQTDDESDERIITVSSATLRDQVLIACMHAGYATHFDSLAESSVDGVPCDSLWRVHFTSSSSAAEPVLFSSRDVTLRRSSERVWCVNVPPHHLVVARRAEITSSGVVTAASRPVITGNCKFWELDEDHDGYIDATDLVQYDDYALTNKVVDRIMSGAGRQLLSSVPNKMNYLDFVIFLISEVDKSSPASLDYFFNVIDVDGDGVISTFEIEYFFEEQKQRIQSLSQELITFPDIMCQMIDMVQKPALILQADAAAKKAAHANGTGELRLKEKKTSCSGAAGAGISAFAAASSSSHPPSAAAAAAASHPSSLVAPTFHSHHKPFQSTSTHTPVQGGSVYNVSEGLFYKKDLRDSHMAGAFFNCFPAEDHQVMTEHGFMYLDEVTKHFLNNDTLRIACYVDGRLEYHPIARRDVITAQGTHRHVDFHVKDTQECDGWSLQPTDNHRMFARVGAASSCDWSVGQQREGVEDARPPMKVHTAGAIWDAAQSDNTTVAQFHASFPDGVQADTPVDQLPFVQELGLMSTEVDAFLELYGYWLAEGWLDGQQRAICFAPTKQADCDYLDALLARLARALPQMTTDGEAADGVCVQVPLDTSIAQRNYSIHAAQWWSYFAREYSHAAVHAPNMIDPVSVTVAAPAAMTGRPSAAAETGSDDFNETTDTTLSTKDVDSGKWFWSWVWQSGVLSRDHLRYILAGLHASDDDDTNQRLPGRILTTGSACTSSMRMRDELVRVATHAGYATSFRVDTARAVLTADNWRVTFSDQPAAAEPCIHVSTQCTTRTATGLVWCVSVPTVEQLILFRRVTSQDAAGRVREAGRAVVVGNTLFNLNKFVLSEQRDPIRIKQIHDTPQLTDWDRYAISGYYRLAVSTRRTHHATRGPHAHWILILTPFSASLLSFPSPLFRSCPKPPTLRLRGRT